MITEKTRSAAVAERPRDAFVIEYFHKSLKVSQSLKYKLYVNHSRGIRKYFFTERVVASLHLGTVCLLILTLVH